MDREYNEIAVDNAETRGMLWGFVIGFLFGGAAGGVSLAWYLGRIVL